MKTSTKKIIIFILTILPLLGFSQLDTKHFIPPLFGREDLGCHYLFLSTPSSIPFDVTITDGTGNLITTQTISNSASTRIDLGCNDTTKFLITEAQLNTVLQNKGLILTGNEPFYVTLRVIAGPQAGSLTSKGQSAALGTDFRTGHLFNNTGDSYRKSNCFGFMATQDSTTVIVSDIRQGLIFRGTTPTGSPLTSPNDTVFLNAGECYVKDAFVDESGATENLNGMNGTHITSDKPIAVNTGSWLGGNALVSGNPSAGRDLGFDQIVPVQNIGSEYVLIKGQGIDNEKTIVVATQDNTDIYINGNSTSIATINAGEYYVIDGTSFSANDNLYLESSLPVYLYQTANGGNGATDDNERQCGLNFLPPVGCSGGKNVFLPDVDFIGEAQINIIADSGATVFVNGVLLGSGDPVIGTNSYVTYKLSNNYTGDISITSDKLIRVALINLSGNIGAAGYFSGFTKEVSVNTQTINADNIAKEGCVPASFEFMLGEPALYNTQIDFTIAGTATNGIDYSHIDNHVTIPAGQSTATIIIDAIQDGFTEPQETIYLIYRPDICAELDTAILYIDDAQQIQFTLSGVDLNCNNDSSGQIFVNASGGFPSYTYHITDENNIETLYSNNPITGLAAGTYSVQVYDTYGCKADALVIGGIFDADTTFLPDGSGATYTSVLNISGFPSGETITNLNQLQQICATMEHSYLGDLQIKIIAPSGESCILKQFNGGGSTDLGEPVATGPIDGQAGSLITDPGTGFEYCFNFTPNYGTMVQESGNYQHTYIDNDGHNLTDDYLPAGSYIPYEALSNLLGATKNGDWTLEVTDQYHLDNGYIFNWNISLLSDLPDTVTTLYEPQEVIVDGSIYEANCGGSNGAINITVTGVSSPYTYIWNTGDTTEDISNLTSGNYSITVTDANSCSITQDFALNNVSSLNISSVKNDVNCNGGSDGSIQVTTNGGTTPYIFNWSNGSTSESISNLSAGTYTLTITDNNNCSLIQSFTIVENPSLSINLINKNDEFCGDANGNIDISVNGGSGSYGYYWNNGSHTQDISNLTGGTYTVTVVDGNMCEDSTEFTLINNVSSCSTYCYLDIDNIITQKDTCGNGLGSIDITVIDATNPYIINWSNGDTTDDINNLTAGTYTVTVNDAANCEVIKNITVDNYTGTLNITNYTINDENCGNSDGSIDITPSGGSMPYSYNWSNSDTTQDISNLNANTYFVTLTDANNCNFYQNFTLNNNTGTLLVNSNISDEICNNNQGSIDLTVSGGNGSISYIWSNGATSQDITNLNSGNYTVTIEDASHCSSINNFVIGNSSGNLNIVNTNISNETCNSSNGSFEITVTGGDGNYTYNWNNGATTQDITNLSQGSYSCTVTDGNGCQDFTGSQYIFNTGGNLEIETQLITNEICGNGLGSANINVSGGDSLYSYLWSNGSTSQDLINVNQGNYTVTVSDGSGCSQTENVYIDNTQGTLTYLNTIISNENCGNSQGSLDVNFSGGTSPFSYYWNTGATSQDISNLSAGVYSLTINDANGCELFISDTVKNNANNLNYSTIVTNEICSNSQGSIDLTVSGGTPPYSYNWNNSLTNEDISGIASGTYSCTITDANGCSISTNNILINNNSGNLSVSHTSTDEVCSNSSGSIDLTVTGGVTPITYNWSNTESTEDILNLSAGNYFYTVTDANGCEITDNIIINNNQGSLNIDSILITNEICNNNSGSINISVSGQSGNTYYQWSNSATTQDINLLNEGTYSCTVTDDNGCSVSTGNLTLANDAGTLSVIDIQTNDETCGNGLGTINLTIQGGTAPIIYYWSNSATTQDITNLSSDVYYCTITDANNCSLITQATIGNSSGSLNVNNYNINNATCGNSNGSIDINIIGGTSPYNYSWSNSATTQDIYSLAAGTYNCQITDANNCSYLYSGTVDNVGANLTISNSSIQNEICGNSHGSIDITVSGGDSPYTFNWSNSSNTEDISLLNSGLYTVTITDFNGCSYSDSFNLINEIGNLSIDTIIVYDENCGNSDGEIDLNYVGGNSPMSVIWNNNSTDEDIEDLSAGTYYVTITDNFGCSITDSAIVNNNANGLSVSNTIVNNENCADSSGSINITITGGSTPYNFIWNTGDNTEDISNLTSGNYSCTITDANNCNLYVNQQIINNTSGISLQNAYTGNETCGSSNGYVDIVVSGGNTPYSYHWSNDSTTEDLLNIHAGTYSCTVTDNSGCSIITDTYTITNSASNLAISNTIANDTCGYSTGEINTNVNGGFAPYTFNWNNGDTTQNINMLSAGNYTITITDATGCTTSETYQISNVSDVNLLFSSINITNDTCGQSNGIIDFQTPTNNSSYTYELNGNTSQTPLTYFDNLSQGTYIISVVENSCRIDSTVIVNNYTTYNSSIESTSDENCGDGLGSINIFISPTNGNYSYSWSNGEFTQNIDSLHSGIYTCEIIDNYGCQNILTATVNNNASFTLTGQTIDENCGNNLGEITTTINGASGNVSYLWNTGDTIAHIDSLQAGVYSVTVVDDSQCTVTDDFTILNNTGNLQISQTISDDFCNNSQGSIDITVSGGSGYYSYLWNTGDSIEDLSSLASGNYYVTITDTVNNCQILNSYQINNNGYFTVSHFITHATCGICNDGSIDLTINGASPTYTFIWSNGATTEDLSNVAPGNYTVTITDEWGCQIIDTYEVGFVTKDKIIKKSQISILAYPNPNNGVFNIDYYLGNNKNSTLRIYNLMGDEIKVLKINNNIGTLNIDLSKYSKGLYYLNFSNSLFTKTIKVMYNY